MPHVIVKIYPDRSLEQKKLLAEKITASVVEIIECREEAVSIAVEDVRPEDWYEKVYKPDILGKKEDIVREPGYEMSE